MRQLPRSVLSAALAFAAVMAGAQTLRPAGTPKPAPISFGEEDFAPGGSRPSSSSREKIPSPASTAGAPKTPVMTSPNTLIGKVAAVVDGDTFQIQNGGPAKLIGVTAPKAAQCGAADSVSFLKSLIADKEVELKLDASGPKSVAQRAVLVYASVGGRSINEAVLSAGHGRIDVTSKFERESEYLDHQRRARQAKAGLWKSCGQVIDPSTLKGSYTSDGAGNRIYSGPKGERIFVRATRPGSGGRHEEGQALIYDDGTVTTRNDEVIALPEGRVLPGTKLDLLQKHYDQNKGDAVYDFIVTP